MHFDSSISLGNLITALAFLAAALVAWRDLNWRVRNLEDWKSSHFHTTEDALKNITMLREAVVKLTAVADGQEKRIVFIEDNIHWNRPH